MGERGQISREAKRNPTEDAVDAPPPPAEAGLLASELGSELANAARKVWRQVWKNSPGAIARSDVTVLGRYCILTAVWRTTWKELIDKGLSHGRMDQYHGEVRKVAPEVDAAMKIGKELSALEKVLGLTPDSRARLPEGSRNLTGEEAEKAGYRSGLRAVS